LTTTAAREAQLEAMVDAALGGHDLTPFTPAEDERATGYLATCRLCGRTVWVGERGLLYSILADECPAAVRSE
jgi:hypothetical protein